MSKTQAEQRLHDSQSRIGCIVCRLYDSRKSDTHIHHIDGRKKEWYTIPLCPAHHQYSEYAVHRGKRKFRDRYESEEYLYCIVRTQLIGVDQWPDEVETKFQDYLNSPYSNEWLKEAMKDG